MTNRTRVRTPRRTKSWANDEASNESLAANAAELNDLLATYYTGRGVTSVPGMTVMKIIGHIAVKCNTASGRVDVRMGIRTDLSTITSGDFPKPYLVDSNWLWQERVLDQNLMSNNLASGVVNKHRFEIDVSGRRILRSVADRLWLYIFNDDATDTIAYDYSLRVLLALP